MAKVRERKRAKAKLRTYNLRYEATFRGIVQVEALSEEQADASVNDGFHDDQLLSNGERVDWEVTPMDQEEKKTP
mgnify:CR=1 FL=1